MANDSGVKTEKELGNLYMNFTLFQITAAPTSLWLLEASVYIFFIYDVLNYVEIFIFVD
jgi:hypothetical protein